MKQCRPPFPILAQQRQGIVLGAAGVHHQRQTGVASGTDMLNETLLLPLPLLLGVEVIQAGFTDAHHSGMVRQADQLRRVRFMHVLVKWMHTDGGEHVRLGFGHLPHPWEGLQIDTDAQHGTHAVGAGGGHEGLKITLVGVQIEAVQVAMGVHQIKGLRRHETLRIELRAFYIKRDVGCGTRDAYTQHAGTPNPWPET